MRVSTIVSFCSNDYRFLQKCVQEALHFSDQVIVPVCDHFFDGSPENRDLLQWAYVLNPDCQFIEFPYSHETVYPTYYHYTPQDEEWTHHWHSFARLIGFYHVHPDAEWVLFLDCDEIPDGRRFLQSLGSFSDFDAARLACYYYAMRADLRASKVQELPLLVRKKQLEPRFFYHRDERYATYKCVPGKKKACVRGIDGAPLIHHYSWVRPESECRQKTKTWGHRLDRDWEKILLETFSGKTSFFGTDLSFERSEIYFNPLAVQIPLQKPPQGDFPHVKKLKFTDYMRLDLAHHSAL